MRPKIFRPKHFKFKKILEQLIRSKENMKYKAIDRTNIDFTSDAEICNIGYFEKEYHDVPIRVEKFVANGITCVTIFIPKIDSLDDEEKIKKFIANNNIINFIEDKAYITELEDINENTFL